jgi:predicted phosphodiesterase
MNRAIASAWVLGLLLFTAHASARQPDGTLGLIQTPNNGIPAIIAPGKSFPVFLKEAADLVLEGPATLPLTITWESARGGVTGLAQIPEDAPEGTYALAAPGRDRNVRAVYVRKSFPEVYTVAHITDTHVGSGRHPRTSEEIVAEVFAAANASEAVFALVTGDLTDQGTPEQFNAYLALMDTCTLPTFVTPGNHDRNGLNYEQFFGPVTTMFLFGPDGYLLFDTKDFIVADELSVQDGYLNQYRRAIKPARWSIGATHRYESSMGMRAQLTLFVDDPLDVLIFGHWHRENKEDEQVTPWGRTPMIVTPAAIDGRMRLLDLTVQGIRPRAFEQVAKTGEPEEKKEEKQP